MNKDKSRLLWGALSGESCRAFYDEFKKVDPNGAPLLFGGEGQDFVEIYILLNKPVFIKAGDAFLDEIADRARVRFLEKNGVPQRGALNLEERRIHYGVRVRGVGGDGSEAGAALRKCFDVDEV